MTAAIVLGAVALVLFVFAYGAAPFPVLIHPMFSPQI